jgi:hypothetical protein
MHGNWVVWARLCMSFIAVAIERLPKGPPASDSLDADASSGQFPKWPTTSHLGRYQQYSETQRKSL